MGGSSLPNASVIMNYRREMKTKDVLVCTAAQSLVIALL